MKPIARFEAVELYIPANTLATKFLFPDLPQLRSDVTKDVIIRSIKFWPAAEKPFDFNGNPVATMAQLQNADLTLYVDGEESLYKIPCTELINSQNTAATFYSQIFPEEFDNQMVDWTKSYISFNVPLSGTTTAFAFLMGVSYVRLAPGTMAAIKASKGDVSSLPGQIM